MVDDEDAPSFRKPSKVYVTQEGAWLNRESIARYGELVFIVPRDVGSLETERVRLKIFDNLVQHYDEGDYILIAGNPVIVAEVFSIVYSSLHRPYKYLAWDSLVNDYALRESI